MVFFKTRPRRLGLLLLALACARGASGQRLWTRDDAAAAIALDFALAGDDLPDCAAALQAPSDAVLDAYAACNNAVDVAVAKGGIAACPPACAGEKAAVGEPCVGEYFSYGAAAFRGWAARLTAGDTLGVEELQYIQRFADIHAPIGGYPAIDATALAAAMPGAVAEILSGSAQALRQLVAECGLVTGEAAAAAAAAAARALGEAPAAAPAASAAAAPAARAALALLLTALALAA